MKKKIIVLVSLAVIIIFGVLVVYSWFPSQVLRPTIKIVSPQDGITITPGDTVNFEVQVNGHFTYGGVQLTTQDNLSQTSDNTWKLNDYSSEAIAATGNPDEQIPLTLQKAGVYKIVAYGENAKNFGSEIVSISNPITVNVVGAEKWQTKNIDGLFSIQIPGEWDVTEQTDWNTKDPSGIKSYDFYFFDTPANIQATPDFTIIQTPTRSWNDNLEPVPLVKTPDYVFTTFVPATVFSSHYGFNDAQIREAIPKVFASFKILK